MFGLQISPRDTNTQSLARSIAPMWRAVRKRRRTLAVAAVAAFLVILAGSIAPFLAPGIPIATTNRAMKEGEIPEAADLAIRSFRPGTAPEGSYTATTAVPGHPLRGPVPAGTPLTPEHFSPTTAQVDHGKALVEVDVTGSTISQELAEGQRITLLCGDSVTGSSKDIDALVKKAPQDTSDRQVAGSFSSDKPLGMLVEISTSDLSGFAACSREAPPHFAIVG